MENTQKNEIANADMELIETALLRNICGGAASKQPNNTTSLTDANCPNLPFCGPSSRCCRDRGWVDYCGG